MQGGPSPRVRGTLPALFHGLSAAGTIPARAGNTSAGPSRWPRPWGPSPRVRGTHRQSPCRARGSGTIPARAGNTARACSSSMVHRDHPRACGEHHSGILHDADGLGPSPRVRGTLPVHRGVARRTGTIPARAGNTLPDLRLRLASGPFLTTFTHSGITTPTPTQQAHTATLGQQPQPHPPFTLPQAPPQPHPTHVRCPDDRHPGGVRPDHRRARGQRRGDLARGTSGNRRRPDRRVGLRTRRPPHPRRRRRHPPRTTRPHAPRRPQGLLPPPGQRPRTRRLRRLGRVRGRKPLRAGRQPVRDAAGAGLDGDARRGRRRGRRGSASGPGSGRTGCAPTTSSSRTPCHGPSSAPPSPP